NIITSRVATSKLNSPVGNGNSVTDIHWQAPTADWVALNTDGSVVDNGTKTACGRDA
ncbi:hypothetical protein A2U01_0075858, partial [Trifolium medium]|nr:hypothetical protein [Trifolium medium]